MSALHTSVEEESRAERRATNAAATTSGSLSAAFAANGGILFHPTEQNQIKESWKHLMRWSRKWRTVEDGTGVLGDIDKVGVCTFALLELQRFVLCKSPSVIASKEMVTVTICRGCIIVVQVVVFGGGSFGTAMACALARQKGDLNVMLLLRDPYVCKDINERHVNTRYLKVF